MAHDAESSILSKAANGIGALFCAVGYLTPHHYVASKSIQQFGKEALKSLLQIDMKVFSGLYYKIKT